MGKQINYWMDYGSFLLVAQKALDLGCTIIREGREGTVESRDVRVVTPREKQYYFHLPEAGAVMYCRVNGRMCLDHGSPTSVNAVIEASYSVLAKEPADASGGEAAKVIRRARLYCAPGCYDEDGKYVPRPDCLTKTYNSLVRTVKKIAPWTEFVEERISTRDEDYLTPYEWRHKEYVSKACLDLVNGKGYRLR